MSSKYDPQKIEKKWQERWEVDAAFKVDDSVADGDKYYVLEMFPYPSGKIHMGHVRNYSIGDVISRFHMMRGKRVIHPMGWDSFGLPAENAAIDHSIHPAKWTLENIDNMRGQLRRMGFSYDWDREISTSTPEYYKWNQWIFLRLLEKGLAYKKRSSVNWCPSCATVLANEQVDDGACWRCESQVVDKELDQWFFKTTAYKDELLEYTEKLPGWPERVLTMQRNWIGKSTGAECDFKLENSDDKIRIFTTRPDTLFGVTFMSLAPEHPLVDKITTDDKRAEVAAFREKVSKEDKAKLLEGEVTKEGVFTGAYCLNPLTSDRIPVYVANFVLMGYGTGAVMAVPAHDQRDFEFAKEYKLPIKPVINPPGTSLDAETMKEAYTEEGVMVNSPGFDEMPSAEGSAAITEKLATDGKGELAVTYRIRDWGISRQRYWGCPIPVVYCDDCGVVPVPDEDLPVRLPVDVDLTGKGLSPLETAKDFVNVKCPKCGGAARRETDTMDTFVDSSWYFLRYLSPNDKKLPFQKTDGEQWMPVDQYIGGIEHAVMHLLYARFFTKALRDLGLVDCDEPFKNLLTQGMVCMETTQCPDDGYLLPTEVDGGKCPKCGKAVKTGAVEKMSKSKKNTVDPDGIIDRYGADTTRLFSLFAAPPERDLDWNEEGVEGAYRFLGRLWRLVVDNMGALEGVTPCDGKCEMTDESRALRRKTHATIKKVTEDIERRFHFNTAIAAVMELVNMLYQFKDGSGDSGRRVFREGIESVVLMMGPFAPHAAEELWERLGGERPLYATPWPACDEAALVTDEVTVVVQVNGKVRSRVSVPAGADKEVAEEVVMKDEKVNEWIGGKTVRKTVYVPDKLFNIVVG